MISCLWIAAAARVLRVKKVHFFPLDIRHESCLKMHPCSSTPARRPFFARFTCIMMNYAIVGRKSTVPKKDAHLPTFSKKGCLIDMREACPFWLEFFRAFLSKVYQAFYDDGVRAFFVISNSLDPLSSVRKSSNIACRLPGWWLVVHGGLLRENCCILKNVL